ncbi:DUF441 family protein [Anaerosalibacter massiliensis]|uniref:UPF0756 membrane protein NSA23_08520 n=1 Tax=Anaerosalibacter massiliensis TaxID=1347392 RepID=A0A9X2S510_9FIRM|nr:DUF441 family protein [Anaerosalibacter massiliensis]MCR2044160.1 DUF441 domain-containing protein [Anaerosalibacter massiliensis]
MINKIVIFIIILISATAKNKYMTFAAIVILLLSFLNNRYLNSLIKNHFLNIGMTFLMIWMLSSLLNGKNTLNLLNIEKFLNINGIVSFIVGFFVVIIASKGLTFLNEDPSALIGVVAGSIIGVTFFNGIPVGTLTASGIAFLIIKLIKH